MNNYHRLLCLFSFPKSLLTRCCISGFFFQSFIMDTKLRNKIQIHRNWAGVKLRSRDLHIFSLCSACCCCMTTTLSFVMPSVPRLFACLDGLVDLLLALSPWSFCLCVCACVQPDQKNKSNLHVTSIICQIWTNSGRQRCTKSEREEEREASQPARSIGRPDAGGFLCVSSCFNIITQTLLSLLFRENFFPSSAST